MIARALALAGLAAVAFGAALVALTADARQDRAWALARARAVRAGGRRGL